MPDGFRAAAGLLPPGLRRAAEGLPPGDRAAAEEFRLRAGRSASVLLGGTERTLLEAPLTEAELRDVLEAASGCSYHTVAEELRQGYLAAPGGVRVGVCGAVSAERGIRSLRELSSVAIRIPRQVRGAGREVLPRLRDSSVLILSPPGAGKTTFLRELVRTVSDAGVRVGLADERGELAAVFRGVPQFDVGRCTDVLTGAGKAEAAVNLLRAMNPQVIAFDEIGEAEDAGAIERLVGCGVRIFATVHGEGIEALRRRPVCRRLLEGRIFQKAVCIVRGKERSYRVTDL